MRAWFIASALVLLGTGAAAAQDESVIGGNAGRLQGRTGGTLNLCIVGEFFDHPSGFNHFFTTSGGGPNSPNIRITPEGLKVTPEDRAGIEDEVTPAAEDRYAPQVEALRAAAVSNSRVRVSYASDRRVTQILVNFTARCR